MRPAIRVSALLLLAWTNRAPAQPLTTAFTYQGELRVSGTPSSGLHDLRFRLYDAALGDTQVGPTLCSDNVALAEGRFTAELDFGSQFEGRQRFLEIDVRADTGLGCGNAAGFVTLGPRQPLTASPYAIFALNAANAVSASTAATATNASQLNGQAASFYRNAANLNAGTIPDGRLSGTYSAPIGLSNAGNVFTGAFTGSGSGLINLHASNVASGTLADARLSANVAILDTSQTFTGGKAFSTAPAFTAAGTPFSVTSGTLVTNLNADLLDGLHASAFLQSIPNPLTLSGTNYPHIIRGENASTASLSAGLYGASTSPISVTLGVYGESASVNGCGVRGEATSATGVNYGGWFKTPSTSGIGLFGDAGAASGATYGVWGRTASTAGRGVFGSATAMIGSTYGGYFESSSTSGFGVYGRNNATSGVIYGVRGYASTAATGYAVYAAGDMGASGVKPFRIDHPMDPENKYLLHYSTESPEVLNVYSGKVTLDGAGEAVVELPTYFASINKDPRYTLTAVAAAMPMLHVAEEISETALAEGERTGPGVAPPTCSFRIGGGVPGGKVSWRVEAVRNDLRVRLHGAPVEREKAGPERGVYQHPEYYGQPPERGMEYLAGEEPAPRPAKSR